MTRRLALFGVAIQLAFGGAVLALGEGADGRFEKRESSHFVLYQDVDIDETSGLRGSRRFEQQALQTLEAAYDRVDAFLGIRPTRRIAVSIYDPAIFDQRFAGLFRFPAAGFYGGSVHIRGATVLHAQLVSVLHHELVHAAMDAAAPSLVLPAWLNEGMAEWFEARAAGKRRLSGGEQAYLAHFVSQGQVFPLAQLSQPTFGGFGPKAAQLAYLQSYAFFDFLVRQQGERRVRDFVRELVRTGALDRSLRKSFRASLADLEDDFNAELRARR